MNKFISKNNIHNYNEFNNKIPLLNKDNYYSMVKRIRNEWNTKYGPKAKNILESKINRIIFTLSASQVFGSYNIY